MAKGLVVDNPLHNVENYRREIRSFSLRQGKITSGQQSAIINNLAQFGIDYEAKQHDFNFDFGRDVSKIMEIGFGMGNATWQIAQSNPQNDYICVEVHLPGVGSLLMQIVEHSVSNIRIIRYDAVEVLQHMVADISLHGVHIFFPDPWHKKRHHKRRIIQQDFIELLVRKLDVGGYIHLATDWQDYATWMLDVLSANKNLVNQSPTNDYVLRPAYRPQTKFENRGIGLGHVVRDIIFVKKNI